MVNDRGRVLGDALLGRHPPDIDHEGDPPEGLQQGLIGDHLPECLPGWLSARHRSRVAQGGDDGRAQGDVRLFADDHADITRQVVHLADLLDQHLLHRGWRIIGHAVEVRDATADTQQINGSQAGLRGLERAVAGGVFQVPIPGLMHAEQIEE